MPSFEQDFWDWRNGCIESTDGTARLFRNAATRQRGHLWKMVGIKRCGKFLYDSTQHRTASEPILSVGRDIKAWIAGHYEGSLDVCAIQLIFFSLLCCCINNMRICEEMYAMAWWRGQMDVNQHKTMDEISKKAPHGSLSRSSSTTYVIWLEKRSAQSSRLSKCRLRGKKN